VQRRTGRTAGTVAAAMAAAWMLAAGPAAADPVQEVTVTLTEYAFEPAVVRLHPGVEARITVVNKGTVMHEFASPYLTDIEVGVETDGVSVETLGLGEVELRPGARAVVTFTPDVTGSFIIVCGANEPVSHLREGMRGTLEVR
jgi:plastocyanin